jgi:hypothetical protein
MENKTNTKKLMISCKEATMLSLQKTEVSLSFSDRIRLFVHLRICKYCRLFDKQSKMIDKLISNWKTDKRLSDNDKNHLQNIIDKELK